MIQGITVSLEIRGEETGRDTFNEPIYGQTWEDVANVLVAPVSADDVITTLNLTGKKAVYQIAVPKGDGHVWEGRLVKFFGHTWQIFTFAEEGIEANIPLSWNAKYKVERYE